MQMIFQICFGVGAGYAVLSFLLGEIIDIGNFDSHFEFGTTISPLKPSVISAFLTVFGGIGSILIIKGINIFITFSIASILGILVAFCFMKFVIIPLNKAQNTSAVEKQKLIGKDAKVTVTIPQGKFGKITYYANGNTYSSPAKSEDGCEIKKYEDVEIICIENNTYFVRPKKFSNKA